MMLRRPPFANDRAGGGSPGVGSATLLLCFGVLCLTVFSLLTLSAARAEERLSLASVAAVSNYYSADSQAEELVALLCEVTTEGTEPPAELKGIALERLSPTAPVYGFTLPIDDRQQLRVELELAGGDCSIRRWQVIIDYNWQADDRLELLEFGVPLV